MRHYQTLLFLFLLYGNLSSAQETYTFKNGLLVSHAHHYGREAVYSDTLAYQLFTQALKKPKANDTFYTNNKGESVLWQAVTADSIGRFRSRNFLGNYLYLSYPSDKATTALLNVKGNSAVFVNGVLHTGDPYSAGYLYIPVALKKGDNDIYIRTYGQTVASLIYPEKPVFISPPDSTMPFVVLNKQTGVLQGAIVIINTSTHFLKNYSIKSKVAGKENTTTIPSVPAMSSRKVIFSFDASNITTTGKPNCELTLSANNKPIDTKTIQIETVDSSAKYSSTFISKMDGSLQYYSVTPKLPGDSTNALFLSVHGAAVEAINQARAYHSKDWGTVVAATNRRPRGFNWEDWGRLDALEVLDIAKERFKPDPQRIYLTGHSMGGHGTWFLGATYPDKWAAIGACSGYPTLKEYGSADGKIPDSSRSSTEQMLLRAGNQSDVLKLAKNYKAYGVYILHGDSDKVVSVEYARQMKKVLADFHPDFSYHEYPGGEHWFGDQSVDWKPLFDFFKWHTLQEDSAVNNIDFTTSSPGISSAFRWASILQQTHPLQYSTIHLQRNNKAKTVIGTTQNVQTLQFALGEFGNQSTINIRLDSATISYTTKMAFDTIYLSKQNNTWTLSTKPGADQKGPQRYGTFKEAFNHNMLFVYGTKGNKEENESNYNKAMYDAESWYYRGNGAVDIISDVEYSPAKYKGRNVIIYGNATTHAAWNSLLSNCPIQVKRNIVTAGSKTWQGDDLGAYFIWPQKDSLTSVGVVAGTGVKGMNAASANQYFAGGSGFPDVMIFRLGMLIKGADAVEMAGFFDNNWKLADNESVYHNKP